MGFNVWNVLIVLLIILLLFGTKKLRNAGGDLGAALKGFKKAMSDDDVKADADFDKVENQSATNKPSEKVQSDTVKKD